MFWALAISHIQAFSNRTVIPKNNEYECHFFYYTVYGKFGNFREDFIFANIVKNIFATLKIHDLHE